MRSKNCKFTSIGLDLGDRASYYCVLDEAGRIVREAKVSTTPKALQAVFGAMPRSRIALETGMHSPWVSRLLSGLGHETWECQADGTGLHPLLPGWNNPSQECCGSWTPDGKDFIFQSTQNDKTQIWVLTCTSTPLEATLPFIACGSVTTSWRSLSV